ncbi:MAG: hypothetical protein HeimC3_27120 [Candidatus Heimdallarchaeota archaeon LC_3]|nr:MAG: hypothetical protein HeimC3_27120 [Candidatus Heimdallarchaeota archaeon LC_3]
MKHDLLVFKLKSESFITRDKILEILKEFKSIKGLLTLQSFNINYVISYAQIQSAVWHATQGYNTQKMISNNLSIEILLFLSGQRQISKAFKILGLPKKANKFGLILIIENIENIKKNIIKEIERMFKDSPVSVSPYESEFDLSNLEDFKKIYEIDNNNLFLDKLKLEGLILSKISLLKINNY